jgi:Tol biopolymer transport system component
MNADGSGVRRAMDRHTARDDFASWHPDGKRLVLVSDRGGRSELYLVEVAEA